MVLFIKRTEAEVLQSLWYQGSVTIEINNYIGDFPLFRAFYLLIQPIGFTRPTPQG